MTLFQQPRFLSYARNKVDNNKEIRSFNKFLSTSLTTSFKGIKKKFLLEIKLFFIKISVYLLTFNFLFQSSPLIWKDAYYRYSKYETLLMAHNWHWVSSLSTNDNINIFGTHPGSSANCNRKKLFQAFFTEWRHLQILLFIYILKSKLSFIY